MSAREVWGGDPRQFSGFAVIGAAVVVRVLLPATDEDTDADVAWSAVAADVGRADELDGYVSWGRLTELPGDGSWAPRRRYRPSTGLLSPAVAQLLVESLSPADLANDRWLTEWTRPAPGGAQPLLPPALAAGDAVAVAADGGPATGPTVRPMPDPRARRTSLAAIAATWTVVGFPGRAWRHDGRVGLAAPAYADSLIVSGPVEVTARLVRAGLEAYAVAPRHPLPTLVA